MRYYLEQTRWGLIVRPGVDVAMSAAPRLAQLVNRNGYNASLCRAPSYLRPVYLLSQLGNVTMTICLRDSEGWGDLFLSVSPFKLEMLNPLEVALTELLLSGEASPAEIPTQASSASLERYLAEAMLCGPELPANVPGGRQLIDRWSYLEGLDALSGSYSCLLGPWMVWKDYTRPHPHLVLWQDGEEPISLPLNASRPEPKSSLDALALFSKASPVGPVGHPAFQTTLRRTLGKVQLYERFLLGASFDWLAVCDEGGGASGKTPREAIRTLARRFSSYSHRDLAF